VRFSINCSLLLDNVPGIWLADGRHELLGGMGANEALSSDATDDIFKYGSTEPAARLYDASRMFEV
jgi:hypothetical protein